MALVALLISHTPVTQLGRDSLLSRQLTLAALDQEAVLNLDSALVLHRAARSADSTDIVAEYHYFVLRQKRFELAALRDEYAGSATPWNSRGAFCWAPWVATYADQRSHISDVVNADLATGITECSNAQMSLQKPQRADAIPFATRAVRAFPMVPALWGNYAELYELTGQTARAEAVWLDAERAVGHPLLRVQLAMFHIFAHLQRGDVTGARALQRVVRSAVSRDGRPGVVAEYLTRVVERRELWDDEGGEPRIIRQVLSLTVSSGSWAVAAQVLTELGKTLIDRGEPLKAIPWLSQAVGIGDSVHVTDLQLVARTLRGRAYLKAGRLSNAEQDLLAALVAGAGAARAYYRADAYHNLAHLYESEGRWPEATRTVDHFVALAKPMQNGLLVTSLLDAGEVRWKAGWHASADAAFREMVSAIARTNSSWHYAGQFFERNGDLDRARNAYLQGLKSSPFNPLPLAGLSRVHAALGHADSAELYAKAHDAQLVNWPPLEVPLLPALLGRRGRFGEAIRIAHSWASRQVQAGNIEGAAIATLQVAQFQLDAGHPDSAIADAERTDSLAGAVHLTRERIRARALRGTALIRLGKSDSGVRIVRSALVLAHRHPSADILFESHMALGDALAATGRTVDALREYDHAAIAVEHATLSIGDDLDRAGYRERNMRPFDGATRMLLSSGGLQRHTDEIVRWSSRRNAAALALGAQGGVGLHADTPRAPNLTELQRRLSTDEAILNYIVLDSTVTAIVITNNHARLVRLPISATTLRMRVAEIRRPLVTTYSGRLDLGRTRYAIDAATQLYATLIRPFTPELAGKKRLLIAPDGPLHALAFDALVVAPAAGRNADVDYLHSTYLLDSFEVEYLPSPAFLQPREIRSREQRLDAARVLAVGYDAPGSHTEIQALRAIWPRTRLTTLESSVATESAVKGQMATFGILHFAVHATVDARDPLASHLRLVPDTLEDGYFHTNEIAARRITAGLVVLSACETNGGPIYNGEGVMGIARAFLASGARAVVGTQWPIGAPTAVLMREFYVRLSRGEAPATALRAAKRILRESPGTAHPFLWAGFVLIR